MCRGTGRPVGGSRGCFGSAVVSGPWVQGSESGGRVGTHGVPSARRVSPRSRDTGSLEGVVDGVSVLRVPQGSGSRGDPGRRKTVEETLPVGLVLSPPGSWSTGVRTTGVPEGPGRKGVPVGRWGVRSDWVGNRGGRPPSKSGRRAGVPYGGRPSFRPVPRLLPPPLRRCRRPELRDASPREDPRSGVPSKSCSSGGWESLVQTSLSVDPSPSTDPGGVGVVSFWAPRPVTPRRAPRSRESTGLGEQSGRHEQVTPTGGSGSRPGSVTVGEGGRCGG